MGMSQNPNSPTSAVQAGVAAQEQRGREFLAARKFRKARDEFKLLCKVDRAKYLPLLIQANQGLVRDMLSKGMVSEAQQVVAYT